ncbi:hypothetical protein SISSUDRAFT_972170, partial [Sistotremastrum suecicum HHB10207 ss-3]
VVSALDIRGRIEWNEVYATSLGQAQAVLNSGSRWSSAVHKDGSFIIPNVEAGVHVLSILAHDHHFDQLRLNVSSSSEDPAVQPYLPGTPLTPLGQPEIKLPYPVRVSAHRQNVYFVAPQGFNALGMLKNPMMLMMVLAGGMILLMPLLIKNMDPETAKDFQERRAAMTNMQSSMQNMDFSSGLAALMGNTTTEPEPAEEAVTPEKKHGTPRGRGRGKR